MTGVTVGIPAWNEGRFLDRTLAQLVKNYDYIDRIIISDNASTDNTFEIASGYAAKYPKIEVQRLEKNVGAGANSKRILNQVNTEYFMLLGAHDIVSDNYFSELVPKLQARPEAVAAVPMIYRFYDVITEDTVVLDVRISTIDSDDIQKRIYAVLHQSPHCVIINQLVRTDVYKKTLSRILPNEINGDCIVAMHTALLGPWVTSCKAAYYYGEPHTDEKIYKDKMRRYLLQHKTRIPLINRMAYIPQKYWSLCREYAPELCNECLEKDIIHSVETDINCEGDLYDEDWLARRKGFEELLRYLNAAKRNIALLGTGIDGYESKRFAEYGNKLHFAAYVRSSDEEIHEAFENEKIESMEFLQGKADEWFVIVADQFHESELSKQLEDMDYEDGCTYFSMWDMLYPCPYKVIEKKPFKKDKVKLTKKERICRALHKYNAVQLTGKVIAKIFGKTARAIKRLSKVFDKMARTLNKTVDATVHCKD